MTHNIRDGPPCSVCVLLAGSPAASDVQKWLAVDKIKMSPVVGQMALFMSAWGFASCAVNPNMTQKWCTPLHADVSASAAAIGKNPPNDPDGPGYTIFIGDRDNTVTAFYRTGRSRGNITPTMKATFIALQLSVPMEPSISRETRQEC